MAINGDALLQAARGTVFTAPAKTAIPTAGVKQFLLNSGSVKVGTADTPVWDNLGHTSNSNKISFSKDGGDTTTIDTWLMAAARTSTEAPTITVSGASVQGDKATLKKVTGGWDGTNGGVIVPIKPIVQKLALFVLAYDDGDKLSFGLYLPEHRFHVRHHRPDRRRVRRVQLQRGGQVHRRSEEGPERRDRRLRAVQSGGFQVGSAAISSADGGDPPATVEAGKDIRLAGQPSTLSKVKSVGSHRLTLIHPIRFSYPGRMGILHSRIGFTDRRTALTAKKNDTETPKKEFSRNFRPARQGMTRS